MGKRGEGDVGDLNGFIQMFQNEELTHANVHKSFFVVNASRLSKEREGKSRYFQVEYGAMDLQFPKSGVSKYLPQLFFTITQVLDFLSKRMLRRRSNCVGRLRKAKCYRRKEVLYVHTFGTEQRFS